MYVVSRRGRGAVRSLARRPRVLDLLLRPRARPAPPRPSAQRRRRGPVGGTAAALHPRMARHLPRPFSHGVMQQLVTTRPATTPLAAGRARRTAATEALEGPVARRPRRLHADRAAGGAARRRRQPAMPTAQRPGRSTPRRAAGPSRPACTPSRCASSRPGGIGSARRCTAARPTPPAGTTGRSAPPASPTSPRTPTASPSSQSSTTTRRTAAASRSPTRTRSRTSPT